MPYNFVPGSFYTGVTANALGAKIERKSAIILGSLEIGKHVVDFLLDSRAVAVSRYGWLKTSYGWLAG